MARKPSQRAGKQSGNAAKAGPSAASPALEVVDPAWIVKALAVCVLAAAILGYAAICLLLYQGSWQLMLHPSPTADRTPAAVQVPFDALRFDAAETGTPRLAAWWIPAGRPNAATLLYLRDGQGSLSADVDRLKLLHEAGANVFAFDYRGFGQSDPTHPNEARMSEDAAAALDYLLNTRHIPAAMIVPYGVGLGAALATQLAAAHPELPALIVDNPDPYASDRVRAAEQSRLLPTGLLLHDRFNLAGPLAAARQPKLLIVGGPFARQPEHNPSTVALFSRIPAPKRTLDLGTVQNPSYPAERADADLTEAVARFLDEYLPQTVPVTPLMTDSAPGAANGRPAAIR
jgi:pimeloyl-ACP methyl ester carboxylesterase